ncbi:CRISPR-associated endonuclease Cas2 [Orenia marismortui]|uniref:CRISPR-associated endoribonuclease Cas2 n=1 Tax=Orenia marismortui TaxID=46469 RepID=A0A4R8HL57_9FIRM|nr:CRISPR-associated endonuclease Cas2 [Orenia marismortui]TDX59014.1 CRISPR-associated protein Cas2 [Orenia marismortui]
MDVLLIYDISEDKIRNRIAETCKDFGLHRIQWSAFTGKLNHNLREELMLKISRVLGDSGGNIRLYPICSKDIKLFREINRVGD